MCHLNNSFKNTDSFWNKTSDCLYEWVTESFLQQNCSKPLIYSETSWLSLGVSNFNHITNTYLFKKSDHFKNETSDTLYPWVTEEFIQPIHSGTKYKLTIFMRESFGSKT